MNENKLKQIISKLSKEDLSEILLHIVNEIPERQKNELIEMILKISQDETRKDSKKEYKSRLPQDLVDKKMQQINEWMEKIENGELCLEADGYEDYSDGYWGVENWVWEYYDKDDIAGKILIALEFATDCICDFRYEEALTIYDLILDMEVEVENEWENFQMSLEEMVKEELLHVDLKQIAIMTLYADYQVREKEERAEDMYAYFAYPIFKEIHIEDIFRVGRQELTETDDFWQDWIALLKKKSGKVETRLLREAILYYNGTDGLAQIAEENSKLHPSLSLTVLEEYEKYHKYEEMEKFGNRALKNISSDLLIREKIALKTAFASDCLGNMENIRKCCYEAFYSNSNVKNYLRLFGEDEMANIYRKKGKAVLKFWRKMDFIRQENNTELQQNAIDNFTYYELCFYFGDFETVKEQCKNPKGSLGWSGEFIRTGIKLFLVYLYNAKKTSKAIEVLANDISFGEVKDKNNLLSFEKAMEAKCRQEKVSVFWNYFQNWKKYYPMEKEKQEEYIAWIENIAFNRANAIVSGQFRNHYREVAILLAAVGDVKVKMGDTAAKGRIRMLYKDKFPRHSSFQREMKEFFD